MDVLLLVVALGLGLGARAVGLPPLVGYLAAGFVLHALGVPLSEPIQVVADLGVYLLLFGIGLKLRPQTLVQRHVVGPAAAFTLTTTTVTAGLLLAGGALGVPLAADLGLGGALVIGFAFSFCSTVFAVKALEDSNDDDGLTGRVAIGVLVIQDLLAVAFLVAVGDVPSLWALLLVPGLALARPVLRWLLDHAGHGETLLLFAVVMAVGAGAELFRLVDVKPDLGPLVIGVLLASHSRAVELSKKLLDLKDLLLVAFFLSIGLAGVPSGAAWVMGGLVLLLLPLRSLLLVVLLARFRLRPRTSFHISVSLSTYSEFGLIVLTAALAEGLVGDGWLAAVAVAVGVSFLLASLVDGRRYDIHDRLAHRLARLGRREVIDEDAPIDVTGKAVLVFGVGRVGTGVYDEIVKRRGPVALGIDSNPAKAAARREAGRDIIVGDALDLEFWERLPLDADLDLVVAAMGSHRANLAAVRRVRRFRPDVRIAAIAVYPDQVRELEEAGVDVARNLYEEAGQGLADDAMETDPRGDLRA